MAENKAAKPVEGQSVEIKDYEFRLLDADEIEVRVGQGGNQKSPDWCSLLLYKDARCDMRRLDEKFGIYGWKRKHELIGQNLFCTVSVYKEGIGWIDKQDVGTPSNTEAVKGQASDSFKRACSCLGVGRELYTAPKKIFINLNRNTEYSQSGKLKTIFHVGYVGYTNRCITKLIIQDENNIVRWYCGMTEQEVLEWMNEQKEVYGYSEPAPKSEEEKDENLNEQKQYAYPQLQQAQIWEDVDRVWNGFPDLQKSEEFKRKCALRKMELAQSKKDLKAVYDAYPEYQKNAEFLAKLTQFKSRLV